MPDHLSLLPPMPDDAEEWFDFVVAEQARTYAGVVRADFAEVQRGYRDDWVPGLADDFARPGTARRLIARSAGTVVGVAAIGDAPADWERGAGLIPAPAARCLDRLYVHPDFHGTGLGSRLLRGVDDGRPLYLWLIDANINAQAFYRRKGFVDEEQHFPTSESWGSVGMHRMVRGLV
ncbi:MAG: GNAT family N-acetyltransferase [Arachnia sp.]